VRTLELMTQLQFSDEYPWTLAFTARNGVVQVYDCALSSHFHGGYSREVGAFAGCCAIRKIDIHELRGTFYTYEESS